MLNWSSDHSSADSVVKEDVERDVRQVTSLLLSPFDDIGVPSVGMTKLFSGSPVIPKFLR